MKDTEMILEVLKSLRDDQKEHRKEMQEHQKETVGWHARAESRLGNIEDDLREHKEGVIQNRKNVAAIEKRTSKLEQPLSVRAVAKWIVSVGAVAGAIVTIIKLVGG